MSQKSVIDEFREQTHSYINERNLSRAFEEQRKRVLPLLGSGDGLILEFGSGPAMLSPDITHLGFTYIGTDLVFEMLNAAKDKLTRHGGYGVIADVLNLPFKDGIFKSVVGMGVLEYVDDLHQTFEEIRRVVVAEGTVIITVPHRASPYRKSFFAWRYFKNLVKSLLNLPCTPVFGNVKQYLTPRDWREAASKAGFKIVADAHCNCRIVPSPINTWFPTIAEKIGSKMEVLCDYGPLRILGTQYVMKIVPH